MPADHYEQVNMANAAAGLTTKSQQYQLQQQMNHMEPGMGEEEMQEMQEMDVGDAAGQAEDDYGEEDQDDDDQVDDENEEQNNEPEIVNDMDQEHQMMQEQQEEEMAAQMHDQMQMMHDGEEVEGEDEDEGQGEDELEDDDQDEEGDGDEEGDNMDMHVAMDGQGGEELMQDGEDNDEDSPQVDGEGEDDEVDEEVAQHYANQQRMSGDPDDEEQMMGDGEDDEEGDEGEMAGEEMYDLEDEQQFVDNALYVNQMLQMRHQEQNMNIEQHDPTGANQAKQANCHPSCNTSRCRATMTKMMMMKPSVSTAKKLTKRALLSRMITATTMRVP